jgi:hypothetical protein
MPRRIYVLTGDDYVPCDIRLFQDPDKRRYRTCGIVT